MGVSTSCRGQGLGKKLLIEAVEEAKKRKYRSIRLVTLPGVLNAACHLYKKFGFIEIDSFKNEFYDSIATLELKL